MLQKVFFIVIEALDVNAITESPVNRGGNFLSSLYQLSSVSQLSQIESEPFD